MKKVLTCLVALSLMLGLSGIFNGCMMSDSSEAPVWLKKPATRSSTRSLDWLKDRQNTDGTWGENADAQPTLTSLVLLAYLSHGETPMSSNFGATVLKAIRYLNGYLTNSSGLESSTEQLPAINHALASMAIAETYAMTRIPMLEGTMNASVKKIIASQNQEGGFDFKPDTGSVRSVLPLCAINGTALKCAFAAGSTVEGLEEVIGKVVASLKKFQNPKDGSFFYALIDGQAVENENKALLTAMGVYTLQILGAGKCPEAQAGMQFLINNFNVNAHPGNHVWCDLNDQSIPFPMLITYYAHQAFFQHSNGRRVEWDKWNHVMSKALIVSQLDDGRWEYPESPTANIINKYLSKESDRTIFATSMATLSMTVYYRYLPTFISVGKHGYDPSGGPQNEAILLDYCPYTEVLVIEKSGSQSAVNGRADLIARLPGKEEKYVPLPLRHTEVQAKVSGYSAKVVVKQQYENPFAEKIEAVYVFPLPQDAAVTDFIMTIGERRILGIIREREEAEKIYKEAKEQGYVASLLTEERPNIFTQKVANIEPGKKLDIDITYFNTLSYHEGEYELVFPMVVGPRFNPPGQADGIGAIARDKTVDSPFKVNVEYLAPEERSGHDISLQVDIDAGMRIEEIASPSHVIDQRKISDSHYLVELGENDRIPNKDFVLRYQIAERTLKTAFMCDLAEDGGTFSLLLLPPKAIGDLPQQPCEMVFVVDCSGSMRGQPIAKVKEAMQRCLRGLRAADSFQVICFSDSAMQLSRKSLAVTPENINKGLQFIDQLEGGGGTMMMEGVKAALDMPRDAEKLRIVSFMTDGYIGNEEEIIAEIQKRRNGARIFSFGVGSSVNRYLIEAMARAGQGAAGFVGLNEGASKAVDEFYKRATHPVLTGIQIDWGGMEVKDVFPSTVPDLFVGNPVIITGRFRGQIPPEIRIAGQVGGKAVTYSIKIDANEETARNDAVRHVWARAKIAELRMREIREPSPELKTELINFSIINKMLCRYTAFLAVDSATRTEGDHGVTMPVPVPVPDGVKYETTVEK